MRPLNWLNVILVLVAAFLSVFWEAAFNGVRALFGAQVHLLPALMIYAAVSTGMTGVTLLALLGGLWFDALSLNPLGISVLPLFSLGFFVCFYRDLILKDQPFAQSVLGLAGSTAVPVMTLVILLSMGRTPMLGWGTLWQLVVMGAGGAVATPVVFLFLDWLDRLLAHGGGGPGSFRPDREIRRGRS